MLVLLRPLKFGIRNSEFGIMVNLLRKFSFLNAECEFESVLYSALVVLGNKQQNKTAKRIYLNKIGIANLQQFRIQSRTSSDLSSFIKRNIANSEFKKTAAGNCFSPTAFSLTSCFRTAG